MLLCMHSHCFPFRDDSWQVTPRNTPQAPRWSRSFYLRNTNCYLRFLLCFSQTSSILSATSAAGALLTHSPYTSAQRCSSRVAGDNTRIRTNNDLGVTFVILQPCLQQQTLVHPTILSPHHSQRQLIYYGSQRILPQLACALTYPWHPPDPRERLT